MTINRHNYEEYFLLYVDNELSLHQRMEVELFAEQNPDLLAELNMLQEATLSDLTDNHISFPDKASLLKHDEECISLTNHEEQFLLYIDNELNTKDRADVEKFVLQQPQLQESFSLLKQTVLQAEAVSHPDKASLYRHEERRVVPFKWVRFAAAAAVLGAAVMLWKMNGEEKVLPPQVATTDPQKTIATPKTSELATIPGATNRTAGTNEKQSTQASTVTFAKNNSPVNTTSNSTIENNVTTNPVNANQDVPQQTLAMADIAATANETEKNNLVVTNIDAKPLETVAVNKPELKVLDTNDDPTGIYIGSLELNRNKVKGFLRKAGNLFSAKAKAAEEDKIQVANFEIKKGQQK